MDMKQNERSNIAESLRRLAERIEKEGVESLTTTEAFLLGALVTLEGQ